MLRAEGRIVCLYRGVLWLCAWCLAAGGLLGAQQEVPGEPATGYHLKVFEDLVQLPTLVLNRRHESFPGLEAKDFRVQLDSGPPFVPLHARLEGDDPIAMALLFDDGGVETSALLALPAVQRHLLPPGLPGKADTLIMYAVDCNLVRSRVLTGSSAGAPELAQQLLESPTLHADAGSVECAHPVHLWDAVSVVGKQLREEAGRRVVVVVTDGQGAGSRNNWEAVRQYLGAAGISMFAIRPVSAPLLPPGAPDDLPAETEREDRLALLAGGTGGLVMTTDTPDVAGLLLRTVTLLRGRYILEFSRPRNGTAGRHQVEVQLPGKAAILRTSGVTVPLREAAVGADSATVPRDSSRDPVFGDRHPMVNPQR